MALRYALNSIGQLDVVGPDPSSLTLIYCMILIGSRRIRNCSVCLMDFSIASNLSILVQVVSAPDTDGPKRAVDHLSRSS